MVSTLHYSGGHRQGDGWGGGEVPRAGEGGGGGGEIGWALMGGCIGG
jgi:hypothetical protein